MTDIHIGVLLAVLVVLLLASAFCSGSETAMMALNRYRLRHLAAEQHQAARRTARLLEKPDRLIGLILVLNNFCNTLAASIATVIAVGLMGEAGIAVAAGVVTLVLLVFSEVAPKTLGALHPERIAFPASAALSLLLRIFYPVVWLINLLANGLLRLIGVRVDEAGPMSLSREEIRTVVTEAGAMIPRRHQQMLLGILDLEKATVEDIMVPRSEVEGIDLEADSATLREQLHSFRHARMPVYRGSLANVVGILHARQIPRLLDAGEDLDAESITRQCAEPYYVPIGTPLHTQLANFQRQKRRLALVVDEYGFAQGLVTLEEILEEIVGKFTTDPQSLLSRDVLPQSDGSYLIDGAASIRELNRSMHWHLPAHGSKTLNGLILEVLESIPERGTAVRVDGFTVEVMQTTGHAVKTARVIPPSPESFDSEGC
ncbi:MAG: HlyC/CorC family transporter [Gammaproteobacteria bacterium]